MKKVGFKMWAAALVLSLGLAGCAREAGERLSPSTESPARPSEEERRETPPESVSGQSEEETDRPYIPGKLGDDFILPDAQEHVYTTEELSDLTKEELRIARNEIYARHGRTFKSDDLNQYFTEKSWYNGTIQPDQFDEGILNSSEKANRDLIQHLENTSDICTLPLIGTEDFPVIDGSTATLPISQALYRMATGASVQEAESAITHDKTTDAWRSLIRDKDSWAPPSDLVIAYEPSAQVLEELEQSGKEIIRKPIGRDALVFLCNRSNPVKSLTSGQVADIYGGSIDNWKAVGGKNRTIQAFQRPEDSGSQNLMEKLVMKGRKMKDAPKDYLASEMGELLEYVSSYDDTGDALGYSVYYYARNMYQKPELTFMAIDGVTPDSGAIRDGSYPFVNDFYAAIRADQPKDSKAYQLFEWLTSEDGQSLINGLGYVGVGEGAKELPQELTSAKEEFKASIPLPEDYVILADGGYLYGETGIGIFDSRMRLLQFIGHIEGSKVGLSEYKKDAVINAQDTLTKQEGYYSIEKKQWVHGEEDETIEYELASSFADNHPEIIKKYGEDAVVDSIYYFESSPPVIIIRSKGVEHYYDVYGTHLLDFDTEGKSDEELPYRFVVSVGSNVAYLQMNERESYTWSYKVYRDGVLFKELISDEKERVEDVCPHFYTKSRGNYLYFYNYQDEPCAKFLLGYYNTD